MAFSQSYFTTVADDSSTGDIAWTNPANTQGAPDSSYATTPTGNYKTHYLLGTGIDTLPAGAVPTAVTADFYGHFGGTIAFKIYAAGYLNSVIQTATLTNSTQWTSDQWSAEFSVGGTLPTAAEVNAGNYGLALAMEWGPASSSATIDSIRLKITYDLTDVDVPADNKSSLSQPSPNSQTRRFLGVQHLGGTPGPDSDDDANIINSRVAFWNP